jgi:hypothetical protein
MSEEFREKWPEMRMKHLELIQNVITRMGTNSAGLKGYCMTMCAAIIGLAAAVSKEQIVIFALPIILFFAALDTLYLQLERGFVSHFNDIRTKSLDQQPDFLVHSTSSDTFWSTFLSWSTFGFYGPLILMMLVIFIVMTCIG